MKELSTGILPPSAGEKKCRKRGNATRKYDGKTKKAKDETKDEKEGA
jgi:hypothetical protein